MSHLGFTGTADGMTVPQKRTVGRVVHWLAPEDAHHGDCVGADAEFHDIVSDGDTEACTLIHVHPPVNPCARAWKTGAVIYAVRPYLKRNRDIVAVSNVLVAAPKGFSEELRSGTWATVRYARKKGIPIIIVLPNGECRVENRP